MPLLNSKFEVFLTASSGIENKNVGKIHYFCLLLTDDYSSCRFSDTIYNLLLSYVFKIVFFLSKFNLSDINSNGPLL